LAAWSAACCAPERQHHDQRRGWSGRSGNALIRGGYWNDGDNAGVFRLNNANPSNANDNVGFR
jgi:hypothetical protein